MAGRADLSHRISDLVGRDVLRVVDPATGWPSLAELRVEGTTVRVALFVGSVGLSHRGRDAIERRFQNPGKDRPMVPPPGFEPLLLGLWESDPLIDVSHPILVSADPHHRIGRTTRFSVFVGVGALTDALMWGWAEGTSTIDEQIRCMLPPLLPVSYSADRTKATPPVNEMRAAIDASGLLDPTEPARDAASDRARRVGTTLVRDARFSDAVIAAYDGLCAMCGLQGKLVEGAHIYPVSAPGSSDEVWNGIALCANHHTAFDRHLVAVDPVSFDIVFHAEVGELAESNSAVRAFVDQTFHRLALPRAPALRPRAEMFERRYEHFADHYGWIV